MPSDNRSEYVCTRCDAQFLKWSGRCTECGSWGTVQPSSSRAEEPLSPTPLSHIASQQISRITIGIDEFDRVMGGGIVPSSLTLITGEPGIGKSTLILQIAQRISGTILYISGEESAQQVADRLRRLKLTGDHIAFLSETRIEKICSTLSRLQPKFVVVDSIQTISSEETLGELGGINQIRLATAKLLETAKSTGSAIFLVGHVTKEGTVAGPKLLEHLVDVVLSLEGDRHHYFRILRSIKNRFGSTNEIGVFEMTSTGLKEVNNPSALFLTERNTPLAGSVIVPLLEGTRVFLTEVQALSTKTIFGYPQRRTYGYDANRLNLIIAVLQQRAGISFLDADVYVNIVGGIKATEPAADLAIAIACASTKNNIPIPPKTAVFGEIGLGGEIRPVPLPEKRVREAEKLGFQRIILPAAPATKKTTSKTLLYAKTLQEAIQALQQQHSAS